MSREQGSELRWFTPRCEVRLCGHATLGTAHVVFNLLQSKLDHVPFSTRFSGTLTVWRDRDRLSMDFPAFEANGCRNAPADLMDALGLDERPSEILEANNTYIAVLNTPKAIEKINPDIALLERFHPYAVIATAPGDDADFVSRYFAPSYGIAEDPVTGSAHCSLAPYWAKRLGRSRLHARQLSERGGELWCELAGERVILKGQAVLTMQGSLII